MQVNYQTESFLDKNRDYVVIDHCNLMSSSKCGFIAGLFPSLPEASSRSSYKFSSVASRFKQQLQALMDTLSSTEPHYVRCVKPNSVNRPQTFENTSVLHQLRCGGVLEAVRISLAGYPTRRTYHEFVDRFGIIAMESMDGSYNERAMTEKILQKLKLENYQLGKTKVFLRAGQIGVLDSQRAGVLDSAAKRIQLRLRTFIAHKDFTLKRAAAVSFQAYCRDKVLGHLARIIYAAKREAAAAILIQKCIRGWLLKNAYRQQYVSVLLLQASIRGFIARQRFLYIREHRAATVIQARWRTFKVRSVFRHRQRDITKIQCLWRRKLAKRELRKLKKEANETGALRLAKSKLEKQLEDLTWRLQLEKKMRGSNDESKSVEIARLQKKVQSLVLELDAAKLATVNECNKNAVLRNQLEMSVKEKSSLEREIVGMADLKNENSYLKLQTCSLYGTYFSKDEGVGSINHNIDAFTISAKYQIKEYNRSSLSTLEEKNAALQSQLIEAKEDASSNLKKLREVEETCSQLQQKLKSFEEKLSSLDNENHVLRQKTLMTPVKGNWPSHTKPLLERFSGALALPFSDRKYETPTPTKSTIANSDSRRSKLTTERQQENYDILARCIKENMGFKDGKPVAASVIYKCLIHWHAFESERTAIFDFIIENINSVLKVGDESVTLPYWLSNASALLCLLQRNFRSSGFLTPISQRSGASTLLNGRVAQGYTPHKYIGLDDGMEARYPAILFKQQLTACVEKIFGLIRDNLKKEISPLLNSCIQAPKNQRVHGAKPSRSPNGVPQQASSSQWEKIIEFLDSLMERLHENHVPSFFIRKLTTQVFSFINISLFNRTGEMDSQCKGGGTSWHELNYIRQAVGFLVIHQKRRKSLEEIRKDLCPVLTVRQIYRISTMYWDDKYGTQSVSNEVVAEMREMLNKDSQNLTSNSFLLDDDLSIPFSTEDISMTIPPIDPTDIEAPAFLSEYPSAQFLLQNPK
ncbi:myosin-15 isoform X1 [Tanacetum coccineum]